MNAASTFLQFLFHFLFMCIEKAKCGPIYKENFKKYLDSICPGFKQLTKAHKLVIYEHSESVGTEE